MRVTVYNSTIQVVFPNKEMIVEGSVGLTFDLLCTKEWESYNKTVVFKRTDSQDQTYEALVGLPLESTVTIPWEILTEAGAFQVGIYGIKDDKVLPTIWCSPIRIENGTPTANNGSPEEPTPTVYAQILDELNSKCTQKTGEDLYNKTQVMVGEIYQCSEDFEDLFVTGYFYQYQANGTYTRVNVQPPATAPVTSVNGQTGDVILTANDVNAYSKSETDTKLSEKQDVIDSSNKLPYNLISDTPTIPTKTSDLNNDSGFITNTVNNLTNYYPKSETYNKTELDTGLATKQDIQNMELIKTVVCSGEESAININTDENGNAFSLDGLFIRIITPKMSRTRDSLSIYIRYDYSTGYQKLICQATARIEYDVIFNKFTDITMFKHYGMFIACDSRYSPGTYTNTSSLASTNQYTAVKFEDAKRRVKEITINTNSGITFAENTTIYIYGVRANENQ